MIRYYFFVANQDFLFYQEPIEEILRERMGHYNALGKEIDFCITTDLGFLDIEELQHIKKHLYEPSIAILSLNPRFIDWLKLRIQCGFKGNFLSSYSRLHNKLFLLEKPISL